MVRTYKSKTERWPDDLIIRAFKAIEIGTSIRDAAHDFGLICISNMQANEARRAMFAEDAYSGEE